MVLIEKLLLAMVGHTLVRISRADLDENDSEGNKQLVKELLRCGKAYVELVSTVESLRARTDHDRISEALVQAVETEAIDTYLERLCQAEQEAAAGPMHVLRVKWLVASHMRAFPELLGVLKRCKDPGKTLRVLSELRYASSPLTTAVIEKALAVSYQVLGETIYQWMFRGELTESSLTYFFVRDSGQAVVMDPKQKRRKRLEPLEELSLDRFVVVMDRVPLESRLSLEWANRICHIGTVARYLLLSSSQSSSFENLNEFNETEPSSFLKDDVGVVVVTNYGGEEDDSLDRLPPPPPPPMEGSDQDEEDLQQLEVTDDDDDDPNVFASAVDRFRSRMTTDVSVTDEKEEEMMIETTSPSQTKTTKRKWTSFKTFSEVLRGGFKAVSQAFDCFDEHQINYLYELADSEIRQRFLSSSSSSSLQQAGFSRITGLLRDTYFLGRGELFRAAMDLMDFKEACQVCNARDVAEFVSWTPMHNTLDPRLNRVVLRGWELTTSEEGSESGVSRLRSTRDAMGSILYADKIWVSDGFVATVQEVVLYNDDSEASMTIFCNPAPFVTASTSGSSFASTVQYPSFAVQLSRSRCVLYLDGMFVRDYAFEYKDREGDDDDDRPRKQTTTHKQVEIRQFVSKEGDEEEEETRMIQVKVNGVVVIDFAFEDPLVVPKWMDVHGRSYFGILVPSQSTRVEIDTFRVEAIGDDHQLPFPKLRLVQRLDFFPYDLVEDLNGAFVALFRLKRSHELLSQAWTECKMRAKKRSKPYEVLLTKIHFIMAKTVSSLIQYFHMDLISAGFKELTTQIESSASQTPVVHLEYLLSFTRLSLQRMIERCSLGSASLKKAMDRVLHVCDEFTAMVLDGRSAHDDDEEDSYEESLQEFHRAVVSFIRLLRSQQGSSPVALDLARALDLSGYWTRQLSSGSMGDYDD